MTDKQLVLQAISSVSDNATLEQITTEFLRLAMQRNDQSLFAKIYGSMLTADDLQMYLNPQTEVRISETIAELQSDLAGSGRPANAT